MIVAKGKNFKQLLDYIPERRQFAIYASCGLENFTRLIKVIEEIK